MKATGIVAEYNPFHNGHQYQLNQAKMITHSDFIIAVMSGNFTQRGTPSISDKYTRTKMALSCGVDMVLELPFPYATASAERFCEASVSILNKSHIADFICFGSESGDLDLLSDIAALLSNETASMKAALKKHLRSGMSFPSARQLVVTETLSKNMPNKYTPASISSAMSHPNSILGIHYLKALLKYQSDITPVTVKRKTASYHSNTIQDSIASATAVRNELIGGDKDRVRYAMPEPSFNILVHSLEKLPLVSIDKLSPYLHYRLIFSELQDLYSIWDIPEDLCRSIYNSFHKYRLLSDLITHLTSKTYTAATVQRAILRLIANIQADNMEALKCIQWIPYIRVLGVTKRALPLLSKLTAVSEVPVITNLKKDLDKLDVLGQRLIQYEQKATAIYYSSLGLPIKNNEDLLHPFIVANNL